ncbi:MAG TPA: hypothetical protein DER07_04970 [Armatimonadetes bacterium]|jgi:high-affinity Fe2+/Pb2+ permease|nr:hypothetical protein [Armatimonadota bacterium]
MVPSGLVSNRFLPFNGAGDVGTLAGERSEESSMNGTVKLVLSIVLAIVLFRVLLSLAYAVLNLVIPLAVMAFIAWVLYSLINRAFSSQSPRLR